MSTLSLSFSLPLSARKEWKYPRDIPTSVDLLRGRKLGRIVSRHRSFSSETTDLDGFVYPLGFVRWSNVNRNGGGGREEVVTNDSFARIRAVTVKTTRSITCSRRTPEGETRDEGTHEVEGGGYNSATRKPVFHRQPLSRETARELRTTTSKKDESRLCRPPRLSLSLFAVIDHEKDGEKKKKRRRRRRLALERSATRPLENERIDWKTYPTRFVALPPFFPSPSAIENRSKYSTRSLLQIRSLLSFLFFFIPFSKVNNVR